MAGDEERCGPVCISLSDLLEGESEALETRWDPITLRDTSVEMRQHLHGFFDPSATDF